MNILKYLVISLFLGLTALAGGETFFLNSWTEKDTATLKAAQTYTYFKYHEKSDIQVEVTRLNGGVILIGWMPGNIDGQIEAYQNAGSRIKLEPYVKERAGWAAHMFPGVYAKLWEIYGDRLQVTTIPIRYNSREFTTSVECIIGYMVLIR